MNKSARPAHYAAAYNLKKTRELITPEGVDLKIKLADGGSRFGAFFIDLILMVIILIAITFGLGAMVSNAGEESLEIAGVVWLLFFFFLRNFYFTFFEMRPKAATPGKRLMKIRVAARKGERLTASAVFARNAMRELEFFLPLSFLFSGSDQVSSMLALIGLTWSGIFLLFPLFNKDGLRAGDLIAGTWVIDAPRPVLNKDLTSQPRKQQREIYAFTTANVSAYGVHELHVLEDVIRRDDEDTLRSVASRIRKKIEWTRDTRENDREFLTAYYADLRKHLETQMMMGKRRKDKFDV